MLWNNKYAPYYPAHSLVRFDEEPPGSQIWKTANMQRAIIQKHSFWEIKAGDKALFWEDSWQQIPRLKSLVLDLDIQNYISRNNHLTVKEF